MANANRRKRKDDITKKKWMELRKKIKAETQNLVGKSIASCVDLKGKKPFGLSFRSSKMKWRHVFSFYYQKLKMSHISRNTPPVYEEHEGKPHKKCH